MQKFLCEVEVDGKPQRTMVAAESIERAREIILNKGWKVVSITPTVVL